MSHVQPSAGHDYRKKKPAHCRMRVFFALIAPFWHTRQRAARANFGALDDARSARLCLQLETPYQVIERHGQTRQLLCRGGGLVRTCSRLC